MTPLDLTPVPPEAIARLDAALDAARDWAVLDPILIPEQPGRKARAGALIFELPQEIEREGVCPGGRYRYVDEIETAITLLDYWAASRCWAAIDIETGPAWSLQDGQRVYVRHSEPYTSPLLLTAISVQPGEAVVFDMRTLCASPRFAPVFRAFLASCRLVAHNALFEGSFFLVHFGYLCHFAFDTMVAHQVATAGLRDATGTSRLRSGLDTLILKYCGEQVDKRWQSYFLTLHPESPIAAEAIAYAAGDVCRLLEIAQKVEAELVEHDLWKIWETIEQPFLPLAVRARVQGFDLDLPLLTELAGRFGAQQAAVRERFAALVPDVSMTSTPQLRRWYQSQGAPLPDTQEKTLQALVKKQPETLPGQATALILEERTLSKFLGTYVLPLLGKSKNPVTGRVHPSWKQASTVTGRMACSDPSVQNWPAGGAWSHIRHAVIAPPGFTLVICDYAQFEVRALADLAREPKMLAVFEEGYAARQAFLAFCAHHALPRDLDSWAASESEEEKARYAACCAQFPELDGLVRRLAECDFHRRTAALIFGVPVTQVTKEQRRRAKVTTFAVPYGAGPPGIAAQAGIPLEEAQSLLDTYYQTYRAAKLYLDRCRLQAKRGWTATPAGRKRFYPRPDPVALTVRFRALAEEDAAARAAAEASVRAQIASLSAEQRRRAPDGRTVYETPEGWLTATDWLAKALPETAWQRIQSVWKLPDPDELARRVARYELAKIEREGTNHAIQATNADATKSASLLIAERLEKLDERAVIILWIHDEIVVVAPVEVADAAARIVEESMIEAAARFFTSCPVEVSTTLSDYWTK